MKKKNTRVRRTYDTPNDEGVIEVEALSEEDIEAQIDKIVDIKTETRFVDEDQDKA